MADNNNNNGTVCHILPCSIEKDVTAPIAQFFHPTLLPDHVMPKKNNDSTSGNDDAKDGNNNDHDNDNGVKIMAAQFRGRGLLCAVDSTSSTTNGNATQEVSTAASSHEDSKPATKTLSKLPSTLMGVALSQSTSNSTATTSSTTSTNNSKEPPMQSLKVMEKFQHLYNWSHEDDVSKVMREQCHGNNDKVGLDAVVGWCDLAHEVHDPIPVPP
mmetsp:Transcript_21537/g.46838  ORF Transcript_21537/g.46838 Transcript_21537/m.46838 type:complete len:214 (+) Transcript_21537:130-771(+)|eukprot:CAMPEP_0172325788 /NCGR_PEP_ID=MMETSP1058-20130122/54769_1 /TAXON_ID=83371 /ORGANISM="Detonula confervacea, Strain CCMP 353" /LENGTH=213 /DNA_ID=CAMNT_0013042409 /DNA_START=95 /DNA_END=736 /DNA_ORIENTATION=-